MVRWHGNLRTVLRHVGTKTQQSQTTFANSYGSYLKHCSAPGQALSHSRAFLQSSRSLLGFLHGHLQHSGISTTTGLLAEADSSLAPVSSPLTPVLSSNAGASAKSALPKPSKVESVMKRIRMSPKKLNLVAKLVRGMRVEDALLQLQVTVKRASRTVYRVVKSARHLASHNFGLNPDRLIVGEAFVGKDIYLKRISYHGKGRSGIMVRPHSRLTVVVRELTTEEEAKIARLKVMNYKKLTLKERKLVPHQLIETTPRWNYRPRNRNPTRNSGS